MKEKNSGVAKALIHLLTVLVIACTAIVLVVAFKKWKEPKLTNTFINSKIEAASELTAAKMTYNGLVTYSDGNIPFITKKAFSMIYRAQVRAGIDLSKIEPDITDSTVTITVPEIEVLDSDISIDENSIQYYDERFALFNGEKKEDAIDAIKMAKADVRENGDMDELKAAAKSQIQVLLEGLFKDCIGDRTLEIRFK